MAVKSSGFTRKRLLVLAAIISWTAVSGAMAQTGSAHIAASDRYVLDQNYFKLPTDRAIGSTAGLAIHPDGSSIWVFDRCGANNCVGSDLAPIMQLDLAGELLQSFGKNLFVRTPYPVLFGVLTFSAPYPYPATEVTLLIETGEVYANANKKNFSGYSSLDGDLFKSGGRSRYH
jgi:hypothetical protein